MSNRKTRAFVLGLSIVCHAGLAFAEPELDDDPPWALALGLVDPEPQHDLWVDGASTGSVWVSVQATFVQQGDGHRDFAAMALLGVPLERLGHRRQVAVHFAEKATLSPGSGASEQTPPVPSPPLQPQVMVSPNVARAAMEAALEHARIEQANARIDRLASRARASALLPELRLRVTRQLDDAQVLSPTEYDPDRVTATVKASLWLEARATFKLDKLIFADEEVAFERMREERAEAAKKIRERVIEALFAWQRALSARDDASFEPEVRMKAAFAVVEAEVVLDMLTGGWFSRWKANRKAE